MSFLDEKILKIEQIDVSLTMLKYQFSIKDKDDNSIGHIQVTSNLGGRGGIFFDNENNEIFRINPKKSAKNILIGNFSGFTRPLDFEIVDNKKKIIGSIRKGAVWEIEDTQKGQSYKINAGSFTEKFKSALDVPLNPLNISKKYSNLEDDRWIDILDEKGEKVAMFQSILPNLKIIIYLKVLLQFDPRILLAVAYSTT